MVTSNFSVAEIPISESNCRINADTALSYLLQHSDKSVSDCGTII